MGLKIEKCLYRRIFWLFATSLFIGMASTVGQLLWFRFAQRPIEISVANTNFPLAEFPFPAVTICPHNKINATIALKYLSRFMNGSNSQTNKTLNNILSTLYLLRYPTYNQMKQYLKSSKKDLKRFDKLNITDFMLSVLPHCSEIMTDCLWSGKKKDCCELFSIQRTEAGFCYAFNSFTTDKTKTCPQIDYMQRSSYDENENSYCRLRFLTFSGVFSGLTIFMKNIKISDYFLVEGQSFFPGITVSLDTAVEFPQAGRGALLQTLPGESLQIEVRPAMLESDAKIARIAKDERECMLEEESDILLTQYYSQSSCQVTCRNNFIIRMCNYPKSSVPQCRMSQLLCVANLAKSLIMKTPSRYSFTQPRIKDYPDCQCHSACERIWYEYGLKRSNYIEALGRNVTGLLDIYYARYGALKYSRKLAFSREDLIVSIGGLGNLFLGCSFISITEVFYYFTRSVCILMYLRIVKSAESKINQINVPPYGLEFVN